MMIFASGAVAKTIARSALIVQKNSPGLLLGGGILGMVGSTVLACRATLKVNTVVEEAKGNLNKARTLEHEEYSEKDRSRDISLIYFQSGVKVTRLYAPAIIVGAISIAALTRSHNILTARNAALTAAYTTLEKGFRQYRARVVEKYGEEEDRNLRYGTQEVEILNPETKRKKTVTRVGPHGESIYARFFDEGSDQWSREPEYNLVFLHAQQNYANNMLHARGHVFLNEVYDSLGLSRSEAGAVVGWILSDDGDTDNYIDFGVFEGQTQVARDFVNGFEGSILLDFNVDGVIWDKISRPIEGLSWRRNKSLNE
jgi:Family of unknown function (DUF6353)